ncbi:MAG: hypothetical protein ACR2PT_10250 [Endozoicomonas sp.]
MMHLNRSPLVKGGGIAGPADVAFLMNAARWGQEEFGSLVADDYEDTTGTLDDVENIPCSTSMSLQGLEEYARTHIVVINPYGRRAGFFDQGNQPLLESEEISGQDSGDITEEFAVLQGDLDIVLVQMPIKTDQEQKSEGGEKGQEGQQSGASGAVAADSQEDPKKKPKKRPPPLVLQKESPEPERRPSFLLSADSRKVRCLLKSGPQQLDGCHFQKLSLDKCRIKSVNAISEEQGHRTTLIVEYDDGVTQTKIVLKLTDDSHKSLKRHYEGFEDKVALITFKQATWDVNAFHRFKEVYLEIYEGAADRVYFPETRVIIVSVSRYLALLKWVKPLSSYSNQMVKLLSQVHENQNAVFFLVMQEWMDIEELSEGDLEQYQQDVSSLASVIRDVDESGRNLHIDRTREQLVVLDVELDQILFGNVDVVDLGYSSPLLQKALEQLPGLIYEELSPSHQSSIRHSISLDQKDSAIEDEPEMDELTEGFNAFDLEQTDADDVFK